MFSKLFGVQLPTIPALLFHFSFWCFVPHIVRLGWNLQFYHCVHIFQKCKISDRTPCPTKKNNQRNLKLCSRGKKLHKANEKFANWQAHRAKKKTMRIALCLALSWCTYMIIERRYLVPISTKNNSGGEYSSFWKWTTKKIHHKYNKGENALEGMHSLKTTPPQKMENTEEEQSFTSLEQKRHLKSNQKRQMRKPYWMAPSWLLAWGTLHSGIIYRWGQNQTSRG